MLRTGKGSDADHLVWWGKILAKKQWFSRAPKRKPTGGRVWIRLVSAQCFSNRGREDGWGWRLRHIAHTDVQKRVMELGNGEQFCVAGINVGRILGMGQNRTGKVVWVQFERRLNHWRFKLKIRKGFWAGEGPDQILVSTNLTGGRRGKVNNRWASTGWRSHRWRVVPQLSGCPCICIIRFYSDHVKKQYNREYGIRNKQCFAQAPSCSLWQNLTSTQFPRSEAGALSRSSPQWGNWIFWAFWLRQWLLSFFRTFRLYSLVRGRRKLVTVFTI